MLTDPSFVHLHVRTEFSLLRSMIRVRDLVEPAKDLVHHDLFSTPQALNFKPRQSNNSGKPADRKP